MYKILSNECQEPVKEAEEDPDKMHKFGESLIEGSNGFNKNTQLGIRYLEKDAGKGCEDAVLYYSRFLIENEIIPQDLDKAKSYLSKNLDSGGSEIFVLYGKVVKKEGDYEEAKKYFEKSAKSGNPEAMYEFGKLMYKGQGCDKNEKDAMMYFNMAKKNGFIKSDDFLTNHKEKVDKTEPEKQVSQVESSTNNNDSNSTAPAADTRNLQELKISADKGDNKSMTLYGKMIATKNEKEVAINREEGLQYLKKASESGDAESIYQYALMIENDDPKETVCLLKIAADKGHVEAALAVGVRRVKFVSEKAAAMNYLKYAADNGNVQAVNEYATQRSYDGMAVNNEEEALRYYKMCADTGHPRGMHVYSNKL